jgi:hypothetical protein
MGYVEVCGMEPLSKDICTDISGKHQYLHTTTQQGIPEDLVTVMKTSNLTKKDISVAVQYSVCVYNTCYSFLAFTCFQKVCDIFHVLKILMT